MKLEDQVCTLDQAKRIAGFGVKRESLFSWCIRLEGSISKQQLKLTSYLENVRSLESYPAYNVAELGEMLPIEIENDDNREDDYFLNIFNFGTNDKAVSNTGWQIVYVPNDECLISINGETEAQARAEALIWLLENGYLTAEQLNEAA